MEIGVRVAYPEDGKYDWYEALKPYPAVEVAFRDPEAFFRTAPSFITYPWTTSNIATKVLSIHMPHANPLGEGRKGYLFGACLYSVIRLAEVWQVNYIVAHPQNGRLDEARPVLQTYGGDFLRGRLLCWETFLSKRRFVNTIESIADAGLYACYDTSHMRRDTQGVLSDLETYRDTIKLMHLSNWEENGRLGTGRQHLPLREGTMDMRKVLRWLDRNFDGPVILEYLKEHHHLYLEDLKWAWEKVLG